jgi:XTP/dITP diphosphohydrolase
MNTIIVASNNIHKITEITQKFSHIPDIIFQPMSSLGNIPEIIENGTTFEENALIKARSILSYGKNSVLADDSGLIVDALNGEPGIFSARYGSLSSDEEKNDLILSKLKHIPYEKRTARFICVMAYILPDGQEFIAEGCCEGYITELPRGDHGFGYDPIFFLADYHKTMAQITLEEKNKISHRAKALDKMYRIIEKILYKQNN